MHYVELPDNTPRTLPFYLAMEEYIARHIDADDCFFMWQVKPTVIFGRNQLIENEVNIPFCQENGIETYRRKSGGGCVYADMGNIMLSYITKSERVAFTFGKYTTMIAYMLHKMGIEAQATGRNDILVEGKKVSGNAFYHVPGRSIVHGTMLYDTNMRNMVGAITPSSEKLVSKGVESVRQHITLIKDHSTITLEEFMQHIRTTICHSTLLLDNDDVEKIEGIMQEYLSPEFIYGNNPRYTVRYQRRIENVGEFDVRIEVKHKIIRDISIMGDYFLTGDIDRDIITPLKGKKLTRESISSAITCDVSNVIHNMTNEMLTLLLTPEQ